MLYFCMFEAIFITRLLPQWSKTWQKIKSCIYILVSQHFIWSVWENLGEVFAVLEWLEGEIIRSTRKVVRGTIKVEEHWLAWIVLIFPSPSHLLGSTVQFRPWPALTDLQSYTVPRNTKLNILLMIKEY